MKVRGMILKVKKLKLQPGITLTIGTLIFFVIVLTSFLFYYIVSETVEEQIGKRALHVAKTVAAIPEIQEAFQKENPSAIIQPIVEKIRVETDADFIVVGNKDGIRYAHPFTIFKILLMIGSNNPLSIIIPKYKMANISIIPVGANFLIPSSIIGPTFA
ncbi:histidine kinase [Bacillus pseudomycoides]|nr:histidine kinase [Bacillus pseudomycoides]